MKRIFFALLSLCFFNCLLTSCNQKNGKDEEGSVADSLSGNKQINELTILIKSEPGNAALLFKRAKAYEEEKNLTAAFTDLEKAVQLDSTKTEYLMLMSDISFKLNKIKNSKACLEKVRGIDPENYDAALRLSELYLYVRQNNLSIQYADTVLGKQPDNGKALLLKGFNLKEKGDTTGAVKVFQKAVEYDQQFFEAYVQLGVLFQAQNNKLALEYYNNALRIKPNAEDALYGRGLWYQDHSEINKAIQDYTSIIQLNPKNKNAHFNLGYIHQSLLKVYDEAAKHYTRAIEADPSYVEAYYNRGVCYETLGNISMARVDYEKAIEIKPDYEPAKNGLSRM
ncbi:MAG: tetratricopeptide repeat protein [Bacteroidetes bacterium]|nr:tetratricopeptide repeat protein [Bacteroidota bacterium]